ncbi:hypothetical protein BRADI_2g43851v3 [Brachypodium distachyon]|uniref:Uncharacterized protein n=1 Tax=Brachypodium distachyon TaxID=15368 RepID=A0A0Q3MWV1_BRADI|nr:hypothetical protein BRADI_2g43851v3 [Brachypodium distachyon]
MESPERARNEGRGKNKTGAGSEEFPEDAPHLEKCTACLEPGHRAGSIFCALTPLKPKRGRGRPKSVVQEQLPTENGVEEQGPAEDIAKQVPAEAVAEQVPPEPAVVEQLPAEAAEANWEPLPNDNGYDWPPEGDWQTHCENAEVDDWPAEVVEGSEHSENAKDDDLIVEGTDNSEDCDHYEDLVIDEDKKNVPIGVLVKEYRKKRKRGGKKVLKKECSVSALYGRAV